MPTHSTLLPGQSLVHCVCVCHSQVYNTAIPISVDDVDKIMDFAKTVALDYCFEVC